MSSTSRIQLLDSHTINQIAAGEVVERPASVVKELLENALDAGASRIEILLEGAGKDRIRIRDNGHGMTAEEIQLCLQRHATSKIRRLDDLELISSLGFRGEAIPSIASVSRMTISSATEDGIRNLVQLEGGSVVRTGAEAGPKGTEITVDDLFYNTPARLKFLKSDTTEVGQIVDLVMKYAVSRPQIAFSLIHNGQSVLQTQGGGDPLEAIAAVWSRELAKSLVPVESGLGGLEIRGFVSPPHVTKPNRNLQYLYVNGRPMKSRTLTIALDQAFRDLTPDRRFPLVVLDLQIDPARVDINVSPTKSEVRFQQEGLVFEALRVGIRESLLAFGMMPSAAQIAIANQALSQSVGAGSALGSNFQSPMNRAVVDHGLGRSSINDLAMHLQAPLDTSPGQSGNLNGDALIDPFREAARESSQTGAFGGTSGPQIALSSESMPYLALLDDLYIVGQAMNTFIIAETRHGMVIVDQHVAHERILYEYLCGLKRSSLIEKQPLLVPQTLDLDRRSAVLLQEKLPEIQAVGFELEAFGSDAYLIRAIPAALRQKDPVRYLTDLIDELVESSVSKKLVPTREAIWIMSACKMAVKAGDPLSKAEMEKLLIDLATTENPYHCPHGRPITATLTHDDLLRLFKRI